MYKSYRFRMYPTTSQIELIHKTFGCTRLVYNLSLIHILSKENFLVRVMMMFINLFLNIEKEEISQEKVSLDEIQKGDVLICRPGEKFAVDGEVVEGEGYVLSLIHIYIVTDATEKETLLKLFQNIDK